MQKNTADFRALFEVVKGEADPGGWLLLKPSITRPLDTRIEGTTFPAQRAPGKRIKLMTIVDDSEVHRTLAHVVPKSTEAMRGLMGSSRFPSISMLPTTDYEIVAGSTAYAGRTPKGLAEIIRRVVMRGYMWIQIQPDDNVPSLAAGAASRRALHPANRNGCVWMPQLFQHSDREALRALYDMRKGMGQNNPAMYCDADRVLDYIRHKCELRLGWYKAQVETIRTAIRTRIPIYIAAQAAGYAQATDPTLHTLRYILNFLNWTLVDEPNHFIVCGWLDGDSDLKYCQADNIGVLAGPPAQSADLANVAMMESVIREIARSRGLNAGNPWNAADATLLPKAQTEIRDNRPEEAFVFVMDLRRWTQESKLTELIPKVATGAAAAAPPPVLTSAYRPLVLHSENELRFKMSLLPNLGVNPAFHGGARNPTEFAVDATADRREFDEDIRSFEVLCSPSSMFRIDSWLGRSVGPGQLSNRGSARLTDFFVPSPVRPPGAKHGGVQHRVCDGDADGAPGAAVHRGAPRF